MRWEEQSWGHADRGFKASLAFFDFKSLGKSGYLCFTLGFLFCGMGIKEPPYFTVEGTKGDIIGKAPGTWQTLGEEERMKGRRLRELATGRVGGGGEGGEGRGGSEPGSQGTPAPGVQAAPGGRAIRRRPDFPPSFPSFLTYRPMRASRRRRFRVQASPKRPWKRRPAGSTSGPAASSLAVLAGAGRRPPMIGWLPRRWRNTTGGRSAGRTSSGRTGSGRTERFRCVW